MSDAGCIKDSENGTTLQTNSTVPEDLHKNELSAISVEHCVGNKIINTQTSNEYDKSICAVTTSDGSSGNRLRKQSSSNINNILNLGSEAQAVEGLNELKINEKSLPKAPNSSKRKHRSRVLRNKSRCVKKRKWRPLWKLTNIEREKIYKREIRRIQRDRDQLINAGAALAPHNTTEFIMKDHFNMLSDDEDKVDRKVELAASTFDEDLYYDKEFEEVYESVHMNFYDKLTKFELVERYIDAEDQIEALEKQLSEMRERKRFLGLRGVDVESEMTKIEVFQKEINNLIEENNELYEKNERLKNYLTESL